MRSLLRRSRRRVIALLFAAPFLLITRPSAAQVPIPDEHFGFRIGTDRRLATIEQIERYFELVAAASDRVKIVELGPTTEGRRTIGAIVSAPENIKNLDQIREVNQRLEDARSLTPEDARQIAATQPAVLAIAGGIHASEVGAAQAANELLYTLAAAEDAPTLTMLQRV